MLTAIWLAESMRTGTKARETSEKMTFSKLNFQMVQGLRSGPSIFMEFDWLRPVVLKSNLTFNTWLIRLHQLFFLPSPVWKKNFFIIYINGKNGKRTFYLGIRTKLMSFCLVFVTFNFIGINVKQKSWDSKPTVWFYLYWKRSHGLCCHANRIFIIIQFLPSAETTNATYRLNALKKIGLRTPD